MGHFDPKVYLFMSEARLAKFPIKENQRVGLSGRIPVSDMFVEFQCLTWW
jgi:hypothetical protein